MKCYLSLTYGWYGFGGDKVLRRFNYYSATTELRMASLNSLRIIQNCHHTYAAENSHNGHAEIRTAALNAETWQCEFGAKAFVSQATQLE